MKSMQKVFMEEFGVINFEQLTACKKLLAVLSQLIDYPEEGTFSEENRVVITDTTGLSSENRQELLAIFDELSQKSLLQVQEEFSSLFEMNRRYTLYMSYYKMNDSRQRGSLLAKLKMLYEMFGVSENSSELSDYLPLVLEFLAVADFEDDPRRDDLQLAFSVLEDGTYCLLEKAISESDKPYIRLIKVIRQVLRTCISPKKVVRQDA